MTYPALPIRASSLLCSHAVSLFQHFLKVGPTNRLKQRREGHLMSQNSKDHVKQAGTSRRGFLKIAAVAGGMLGFPGFSQAASSQPGSPGIIRTSSKSGRPSITIAGYPFDRVKGLVDGKVKVEGCDTRFEVSSIYKLNAVAMGGDQKWEVQEIGLHPFMLAYANNHFRDYTLNSQFSPCVPSGIKVCSSERIAASPHLRTCGERPSPPQATPRVL